MTAKRKIPEKLKKTLGDYVIRFLEYQQAANFRFKAYWA
jgi:hypothetical protein